MVALMNIMNMTYCAEKFTWFRKPKPDELPHIGTALDIAWAIWNRAGAADIKNIKYLIVKQVVNPDSRDIYIKPRYVTSMYELNVRHKLTSYTNLKIPRKASGSSGQARTLAWTRLEDRQFSVCSVTVYNTTSSANAHQAHRSDDGRATSSYSTRKSSAAIDSSIKLSSGNQKANPSPISSST
jgi:hypothetical protein